MNSNLLECIEQKRIQDKNDYPLTICPSCRRQVNKTEARSIFDFDIKICNKCALNEKTMPKLNWIDEE
jgi:hypothetical protein